MKKITNKTRRTPKTTYVPVSNNVYHDGSSYRVRVSVNGTKYSKNFVPLTRRLQLLSEISYLQQCKTN